MLRANTASHKVKSPLSSLGSKRLRCCSVTENDEDRIHGLLSLAETDRYNTLGISDELDVTREVMAPWIAESESDSGKNDPRTMVVTQIVNDGFVGIAGMRFSRPSYHCAEIWYKLHPEIWGNGFATELVGGLLRFGFEELGLHRIEAGVASGNIGSIRVLEKNGFLREGVLRQKLPLVSGWSDCIQFGILETDYHPDDAS